MWLTSWWVAWLLNFYGFSHTNCMVFYRTPWTRYGIPWNFIGTSGNPMAFHGTLRYSMEFHGPPRKLHGISWHSMELHHYFMELCGTPWHSMDTPWISMAFHGTPWILYGTPWHSMELHGIPWRYFTQGMSFWCHMIVHIKISFASSLAFFLNTCIFNAWLVTETCLISIIWLHFFQQTCERGKG